MTRTNCVNCGAPLHGHVCEYCGTEYDISQPKAPMPMDENMTQMYRQYKTMGGNGCITSLVKQLNEENYATVQSMFTRELMCIASMNDIRRFGLL